ncbi:leucine-rich repeat domain-containing protein, partial [Proteus mirabilis]|uniref:leucine-rich repeat domain-containing protein n=1 Tax=Proteus mirabilis TaxID=584 RepID=UPI003F816762
MGRLRSLEALDLRETLVTKLPVEILQLHSLRSLVVYHTIHDNSMFDKYIGASVPTDIGNLAFLQCLYVIQASHGDLDLIRSLGRLKQLRVLGIQQLGAEHGPALCSVIQNL